MKSPAWWRTPLIPNRQISEFKTSLVYKVSSRTARAIQRNPVSEKNNNNNNKKKNKKKNEDQVTELHSSVQDHRRMMKNNPISDL
jgi:hypothetical protein